MAYKKFWSTTGNKLCNYLYWCWCLSPSCHKARWYRILWNITCLCRWHFTLISYNTKPTLTLCAQIFEYSLPDRSRAWKISSEKLIKNTLQTVELLLKDNQNGYHLKKTSFIPFTTSYKLELDFSEELNNILISHHWHLIDILRWAI